MRGGVVIDTVKMRPRISQICLSKKNNGTSVKIFFSFVSFKWSSGAPQVGIEIGPLNYLSFYQIMMSTETICWVWFILNMLHDEILYIGTN